MHDALGSYDLAFQMLLGSTLVSFALLALVRPLRPADAEERLMRSEGS
jgi:hypothetical protein